LVIDRGPRRKPEIIPPPNEKKKSIPLSREDLEEYISAPKGGEKSDPGSDFVAGAKNKNKTFVEDEKVKDKLIRTLEENNQLLRDRLHDLEARLAALEGKG